MYTNTYAFRASALEKGETTYHLRDTGLEVVPPDSASGYVIPYEHIQKVRLYYDPSRFATNKYHCDLHLIIGSQITLKSVHYRGLANFEDRGEVYSAFVRSLHQRLASIPLIQYHSGNKSGCFAGNVAIMIVAIVGVLVALLMLGGPTHAVGFLHLIVFVVLIFWSVQYIRRNKPRTYTPTSIPSDVLPK